MFRLIYNSIIDLVGNTPLVRLKYNKHIILKLESCNPFGSIKDRIAIAMLNNAKRYNLINKNSVIIEASSGNTGIALAAACSALQHKLVIVIPENASEERKRLIEAYGAKLILTPAIEGMKGAILEAERISRITSNYYYINQFNNICNSDAHVMGTAEEIWRETNGDIDFLVASIGTGIELPILHKDLIDEFAYVRLSDAIETCKSLAWEEGILIGPSSGASIFVAEYISKRDGNTGKNVVVICPDSGERYLSMNY